MIRRKLASRIIIFVFFLIVVNSLTAIYGDIIQNLPTDYSDNDQNLRTADIPMIGVNSPINYSLYGLIATNYSITINGDSLNYTWYEFLNTSEMSGYIALDGVSTKEINEPFDQDLWDNLVLLGNGTALIRYYANNSLGETGYIDSIIRIDIIEPEIDILAPTGGYFNSTPPDFVVEISEPNLNETWYTLNTNTTKHFFATNSSINAAAWNFEGDGNVDINFFANDSVGNEATSKSVQVVKDTVNPTGSVIINDDDDWTNTTEVTLSLTYDDSESGVLEVRYSNDGTTWTSWETPSATRSWSLTTGNGEKTVYYEVKDNASLISQFTDMIDLDATEPTGSVIVNDDDEWTNTTEVTLSLTYGDSESGVLEVRYSNDGSTWTAWEAPGATRSWSLTSGDGAKTVYYEVKNNASIISQFTDTIDLDTTPPTGAVKINGDADWTNTTEVTLSLTYGDSESGVLEVRYSNDGSTWTAWETPGATRSWSLTSGDGAKTVYYEVKNNASIISQFTDTIDLDTTPPTGTIVINDDVDWTNTTEVTLSLTYGDPESGVLEVRYSNDGSTWTAWETPSATRSWSLTTGDGTKTVYYEVKNNASLISQFTDTIDLDTTPPTGAITINDNVDWTNTTEVTLSLTYGDSESGILEVRYSNDGSTWTAWEVPSATRSWSLTSGDGAKTVYYEVKNNASIISQFTDTIDLDTTPPTGTIVINDDVDWTNTTEVTLSLTYGDPESGVLEVRYSNDGSTWTAWEVPSATRSWSLTAGDGTKTVYYEVKNNASLISQFTDTIDLDTTPPTLIINSPSDGSEWNSIPNIQVTATDPNFNSVWYIVGGTKILLSNGVSEPLNSSIWNNLSDEGPFIIYFYANDSAGNTNNSYSYTLYKDVLAPRIIINQPTNSTYYANPPIINITVFDANLNLFYYMVGTTQKPLTNNTNVPLDSGIWASLDQGEFVIYIYAWDTLNNLNDTYSLNLYKDTLAPGIIINSPSDNSYWNSPPPINVSAFDPNFHQLWYKVNTDIIFLTNGLEELLNASIWSSLEQGPFTIEIYANDTFNQVNNSYVLTLYKDTITPSLIMNLPINGTIHNSPPLINITIFDSYLDTLWYSVEGSTITLDNNTQVSLNSTIWDNLPEEGEFLIYFYANDSAGNLNNTFVFTLYKDIKAPIITIDSPQTNDLFGENPPPVSLDVQDDNLDEIWYQLSNGTVITNNYTWTGTINETVWEQVSFPNGTVTIRFFANDTFNQLGSAEVLVRKDTRGPVIMIEDPQDYDFFGIIAPNFTIYLSGTDLNNTWYTLDNGVTNFTFTGLTGTINQTAWDIYGFDNITITFYVNDTLGRIGSDSVIVSKDPDPPLITINSPDDGIYYGDPPDIQVTATDPNLDSVWYVVGANQIILTNGVSEPLDSSIWDGLPQGQFLLRIYANDTLGYTNDTFILTLYKDTLAPFLVINNPTNQTYYDLPPPINITVYDPNFTNMYYRVGTYPDQIPLTNNTEDPLDYDIWDSLDEGEFNIYLYAWDSLNHQNNTYVLTLYKDTNAPSVEINSPSDNSYWNSPPPINVSASDPNFHQLWYKVDTDIIFLTSGLKELLDASIWSDLGEGLFTIEIYANDTFGQLNNSFIITLYKDLTPPTIEITSPSNNTYYNIAPNMLFTATDGSFDSIWYIVNNTKIFLNNGVVQQFDTDIWDNLPQGAFEIFVFANDTAGNLNNTLIITLLKDTLAPIININLPYNNTYWSSSPTPTINVEVFDPNLDIIWYNITDSGFNSYYDNLDNETDKPLQAYSAYLQGMFLLEIIAEDAFGQKDSIILTLYKDTVNPEITIDNPKPNDVFGENPPQFVNLTIQEPNLDEIWYQLRNGTIITNNYTWTGEIDEAVWNQVGNGSVTIRFYANDSAKNFNYQEVTVRKNIYAPIIIVYSPGDNQVCGVTAPSFTIDQSGLNINTTWYMLIGVSMNYTFEGNSGEIDQEAWDNFDEEFVTIRFYINDSFGKIGMDEVIVMKDPSPPILIINSPTNQTAFASEPFINLTIIEPHLDSVWYKVGTININITGNLNQYLDSLIWNNLPQGTFTLEFFASDTLGNVNDLTKVQLSKDTLGPNISIILPIPYQEVDRNAPYFELSIVDTNGIALSWYRIEEGDSILFTGSIGRINTTLWANIWDGLADGDVITIQFYARDTLGNVNYTSVDIVKSEAFNIFKFFTSNFGMIVPIIGLGVMVPGTAIVARSRAYKSLDKKGKSKLNKFLFLLFFISTLALVTYLF